MQPHLTLGCATVSKAINWLENPPFGGFFIWCAQHGRTPAGLSPATSFFLRVIAFLDKVGVEPSFMTQTSRLSLFAGEAQVQLRIQLPSRTLRN